MIKGSTDNFCCLCAAGTRGFGFHEQQPITVTILIRLTSVVKEGTTFNVYRTFSPKPLVAARPRQRSCLGYPTPIQNYKADLSRHASHQSHLIV